MIHFFHPLLYDRFFLVMSQQQPTQVYPVSSRCISRSTFPLFPIFLLRIFSPLFPDPCYPHIHTILAFPPSSLRIIPFREELGELPTCLSSCVTISLSVSSPPVLLKGLVGLDGEFFFVVGWILVDSVLIVCQFSFLPCH